MALPLLVHIIFNANLFYLVRIIFRTNLFHLVHIIFKTNLFHLVHIIFKTNLFHLLYIIFKTYLFHLAILFLMLIYPSISNLWNLIIWILRTFISIVKCNFFCLFWNFLQLRKQHFVSIFLRNLHNINKFLST